MKKQLAIDELRNLITQKNQLQTELSNNDMVTMLMQTKAANMQSSPPDVLLDMELEKDPGLTIAPCQLRPESRGSVHARSANPAKGKFA